MCINVRVVLTTTYRYFTKGKCVEVLARVSEMFHSFLQLDWKLSTPLLPKILFIQNGNSPAPNLIQVMSDSPESQFLSRAEREKVNFIIYYVNNHQFNLCGSFGNFLHSIYIILPGIHYSLHSNKNPFNVVGFET